MSMQRISASPESGAAMLRLAERLFPLHRTLVNRGYDASLRILQESLPLDIQAYPSGTPVWDWIIPQAWDVREAWVETLDGERLVDYADNILHLAAYSRPFSGEVSREELLPHLHSIPELPEAIPYDYLYYREDWRFCIPHSRLSRFDRDRYRVRVDVDLRPGELKAASCVIPGEIDQEIVFATYLCHPNLANDNLSGVVACTQLFQRLLREGVAPRHTLRLLIVPETIGAIAWLAHNEDAQRRIIGGFNVYDCGDRQPISYKRSSFGEARADRAAEFCLRRNHAAARILPWSPHGSDERQFNAPGVRLPFGAVMRGGAAGYPEYHTSLDTLDVLSAEHLADTVDTLLEILFLLDNDLTYASTCRGEPCLSRHQIRYPVFTHRQEQRISPVKALIHELDGEHSLLDICRKWDFDFEEIRELAKAFADAGVARLVPRGVEQSRA